MKFEDGDLLYMVLADGREVIGRYGSQEGVEEGFYRIYGACFTGLISTPKGPQKTMLSLKGDDFSDLMVGKTTISTWRKAIPGSSFEKEYIRVTTGILPPTPEEEMRITRRTK